MNNQRTRVLRGGKWVSEKWMNVFVGDILRGTYSCIFHSFLIGAVEEDEQFPCDLVAISSNHPNGDIFIDTAQLDGYALYPLYPIHHLYSLRSLYSETGHKQKSAVGALNALLTPTQLSRLKGIIRTPPPYVVHPDECE